MPSQCKSCGADIVWVETDNGKAMPLSVRSKQRRFIIKPIASDRVIGVSLDTYLSHFADCPHAEQHRKDRG